MTIYELIRPHPQGEEAFYFNRPISHSVGFPVLSPHRVCSDFIAMVRPVAKASFAKRFPDESEFEINTDPYPSHGTGLVDPDSFVSPSPDLMNPPPCEGATDLHGFTSQCEELYDKAARLGVSNAVLAEAFTSGKIRQRIGDEISGIRLRRAKEQQDQSDSESVRQAAAAAFSVLKTELPPQVLEALKDEFNSQD